LNSELRFIWPYFTFRPVKLKKLYWRSVVDDEGDRNALRWTVRLYQYFLACDGSLNVINNERHVRHGLEQLRQIAAGLELHPFHTVSAVAVTRSVDLKLFDVILFRQRPIGGNTDMMIAEFGLKETKAQPPLARANFAIEFNIEVI